ncbi:MAG: NTP transferase domain-containing protein [Solirubrobacteraceae bacterium]
MWGGAVGVRIQGNSTSPTRRGGRTYEGAVLMRSTTRTRPASNEVALSPVGRGGGLQRRSPGRFSSRPAQAVILAAGTGSRLGTGRPKCLAQVGGRPLIAHQVDALRAVGVESIVIVVGFEQDQVRDAVGSAAQFVVNERFAETNSLYSFWMAAELLCGDAYVLNADVLFDQRVLWALEETGGSALAFDSTSGSDPEHMKLVQRDGVLVEMRKDLAADQCCGENVGVLRLERGAVADALAAAHGILTHQGLVRDWLGSAINRIAWRHQISCVDIAGTPWVEIDFPQDLRQARARVWPAIAAARLPAIAAARLPATGVVAVAG